MSSPTPETAAAKLHDFIEKVAHEAVKMCEQVDDTDYARCLEAVATRIHELRAQWVRSLQPLPWDSPLPPAEPAAPEPSGEGITLCPRCEGSGTYQRMPTDSARPCSLCDGTGRLNEDGEAYRPAAPAIPPRDDRGWIQTYTGKQAWPLNPKPEDICIEDIAHALSMICRYTGHVRTFYSVAQHSVLASYAVPPEDALWALLHDATEAYLCDVARPVKPFLGDYKAIERRLMNVVADVFGLGHDEPASVKRVDLVLLATERRDLMSAPPIPWLSTENIEPLRDRVVPWSAHEAKVRFLARFTELVAAPAPASGEAATEPKVEGATRYFTDDDTSEPCLWRFDPDGRNGGYRESGGGWVDAVSALAEIANHPSFREITAAEADALLGTNERE